MTKSEIEEIRRRKPLTEVIEENGFRINSRGFIKCPFHDGDKGASLRVYANQNTWYCFGCNSHGDQFDFVQKLHNVDLKTAFRMLGGVDRELTWAEKEKIRLQRKKQEKYRIVLNNINAKIAATEELMAECERGIRFDGILQGTITESMVAYARTLTKCERDLACLNEFKHEWMRDYERYI